MDKSIARSLALLTAVPAIAVAGNTLVFGNFSAWTVHTDPEQNYRCFAEAEYEGGSFMRIGYGPSDPSDLYLAIGDSAWRGVAGGQHYDLTLQIDEQEAASVKGSGLESRNGFRIAIPAAGRASFLEAFKRGYSISVGRPGQQSVMLSLGGTLGATRMLEECQSSMSGIR